MPVTNQLEIEIKAKSDKATASLDSLISKLNEVNTALNGLNVNNIQNIANSLKGLKGVKVNVGSGGNATSNANNQYARANSLIQTLTATSNKANASFLNLNKTVFKLAATWGMFYASAYPFIRALNSAWKSTQSAMDYVETYNYYSVTMDKIFSQVGADAAESFQKSYINSLNSISEKMTGFTVGLNGELLENYSKNLGADPEQLMNYQARIGAVTNAVGLLAEQSVDTQKALSMLSQDLSSLTNTDLDSVMTNLSSGLIGQSRALYKYGIDITNATLKEYVLANGVTKSVSAMTQAEKMQLRLVAILDQSKVAWGDMANTVNSVSNQYRIFSQNVSNLSRVLGNIFLPIITKVLPYVNALMITLRQLFTMLGFKLYGDNWLKDTLDGISSGYSGDDIVDGLEDIEDAADGASGSANKLKKALMGFDELNIIDPNSSSGSGSGGGGGSFDLTDAIEAALGDYESIWNKAFEGASNKAVELANKIMSYIKRGNFEGLGKWISDNLAYQLNKIDWERIYSGAKSFGTGLAQFLNGLVQPETFYAVGRTVANSLNTAIYTALAFGKEFDFSKLGVAIGNYWNGIFENFDFAAFGETVGIWVGGIVAVIGETIKTIKWDKLFDGIKDAINGFFKGLSESDMTISDLVITLGFLSIRKILKLQWSAMVLKAISQSLAKALAKVIGVELAADATLGTAVSQGIVGSLTGVFPKLAQMIRNMVSWEAGGVVAGDFSTLAAAFETTFGAVATAITGFLGAVGGAFLTVHEIFDMVENGIDAISVTLASVGGLLTALGIALTGPVGAGVAIVAALAAAFIEVKKQAKELAETQLDNIFNDLIQSTEGGTHTLDDFRDSMQDTVDSVTIGMDEVNRTFESLDSSRNQVKQTTDSIGSIAVAMGSSRVLTEDEIAKLGQSFEDLDNQLQQAISASYDYIIAETMADYQYLQSQGEVTEEVKKKYEDRIQKLYENKQAQMDSASEISASIQEEMQAYNDLKAKYDEHLISEEELIEAQNQLHDSIGNLLDISAQYGGTNTELDQTLSTVTDSMDKFAGKLDLSKEALTDYDDIVSVVGDTIDDVEASFSEGTAAIEKDLTDYKGQLDEWVASGKYSKEEAEALLDDHTKIANDKMATLQKAYSTNLGYIQDDVIQMIPKILQSAGDEWDNMTYWEQMMSGFSTKEEYVKGQLNTFVDNVIDGEGGLSSKFNSAFANADLIPDSTMSATVNDLMDRFKGEWSYNYDWQGLSDEISGNFYDFGTDSTQGFVNGIEATKDTVTSTMNTFGKTINDAFHDSEMDFGSPSKRMEEYGKWTIEGYNNYISDNKNSSYKVMSEWANAISESFSSGLSGFTDSLSTWYNNDIVPWFSKDKWSLLGENLRIGLNGKWGEILTNVSTTWNSIKTTISDSWKEVETDTFISCQQMYSTISTQWGEIQKDTFLKWTAISTDLLTKFTEIKTNATTTFNGIKTGIKSPINGIISLVEGLMNKIADGFNAIADAIKKLTTFDWTNPLTGTQYHSDGISLPKIKYISIPQFAVGGFPEDGLFFANHNEMVGQFSNGQTAVANNVQIIEGIASGVQKAFNEALSPYLREIANNTSETASNTEDIKNKPTQTLSNRQIAQANLRGQRSLGLQLRTT